MKVRGEVLPFGVMGFRSRGVGLFGSVLMVASVVVGAQTQMACDGCPGDKPSNGASCSGTHSCDYDTKNIDPCGKAIKATFTCAQGAWLESTSACQVDPGPLHGPLDAGTASSDSGAMDAASTGDSATDATAD